ncbi:hypothetical protein D9611_004960 [Ephemerocybe angulata]|uniref:F-box domain-containing protein n=1 Tax=Ephemerocybe angulata TaxID=980116 RepID=A0A8H5EXA3_9AGAR|nr:hypothetical protein D9611_004960 [Tulosesus angulatus]
MVGETFKPWQRESFYAIHVAHVCRYWKEIALNCPGLWVTPLFFSPGLLECMVARSRNLPITVSYRDTHTKHSPGLAAGVLDTVSSQMARIQSLELLELEGEFGRQILSRLTQPMHMLERMSLSFVKDVFESIPEGLLAGRTPSLKELYFECLYIRHWDKLPVGPGLTHLEIRYRENAGSEVELPSIDTLLQVLKLLPLLRVLSLAHCLPVPNLPEIPHQPVCPSLQRLCLEDWDEVMCIALEAVALPKARDIELRITYMDFEMEFLGMALDYLKAAWAEKTRLKVLEFDYAEADDGDFHLKFKMLSNDAELVTLSIPIPNSAYYIRPHPAYETDRLLTTIDDRVDFSSLAHLRLSGELAISLPRWKILSRCETLHTVSIAKAGVSDFVSALQGKFTVAGNENDRLPSFPGLSTLEFVEVDFEKAGMSDSIETRPATFRLQRALNGRPIGRRVSSLTVKRCKGFSKKDYSHLKWFVPKLAIQWDEYEAIAHIW